MAQESWEQEKLLLRIYNTHIQDLKLQVLIQCGRSFCSTTICCTAGLLVSFNRRLWYKGAAETPPPANYGQVRPAALMLTAGVDTAAAVVNLHM